MPTLRTNKYSEQRKKLRVVLAGSKCVSPASVYDPLSARVAEAVGFEIGMLVGSVASSTMLAAPDLLLHTLTEYADQIRRIMRVSRLSLFVDADQGYGNAPHLFNGGAPADLRSKIASAQEMEQLVNGESYKQWLRQYMR